MDLEAVRAEIAAEIKQLQRAYDALGKTLHKSKRRQRKMSIEARRRISRAQKARWKKHRAKAA